MRCPTRRGSRQFLSFRLGAAIWLGLFLCWPGPVAPVAAAASAPPTNKAEEVQVYGASPPSTFTLYALDPDLIAGWNTPLYDYEKQYIPVRYHSLPVLGGWYGQGFIPDRGVLLAAGLKRAFLLSSQVHPQNKISAVLKNLGMEVVAIPGARLSQTPAMFRELGKAFDREERGEALAQYGDRALQRIHEAVGGLPPEDRARVYYAMEEDGLGTVCADSERSDALEAAGGQSVHSCPKGTDNAMPRISFEQLMAYDPEVILVFKTGLMARIPTSPKWQYLSAVKNNRVYLVPRGPFSWLDRPATYMRLIGVQWVASKLHPNRIRTDIADETKAFMRLFFHLEMTDTEVDALLNPLANPRENPQENPQTNP